MSDWWLESVFYQVYLPSFQDSDGNGIGDLRGVIERIDYFKELGIDAIWITPFYESPKVDNGYDISNHRAVDPAFGSMDDFEELILKTSQCNIKVVIDIILNHTSDQHPFFLESKRSRNSPKRDWYIWHDANPDGSPPNNWEGFEKSSWTFNKETNQYYYHFFYSEQPDLNWRNPEVVAEMFDVCNFWLKKGVAGLRLDAVNFLLEDESLRDNPYVDELPEYLKNIFQFNQLPKHTINQLGIHNLLKELRQFIKSDNPEDPLLIGEIWVEKLEELRQYYGKNNNEIHLPFNFFLSSIQNLNTSTLYRRIKDFKEKLDRLPTTLVFSNHDFPRATTRYSNEKNSDSIAKLLAVLLLTLPGVPFIYYGEELGMRDLPPKNIEELRDKRGKFCWNRYKGRDGCRRPMQWDTSPNAGFTTGKPWLDVDPNYIKRNVAVQTADPDSIFNCYKNLIIMRRNSQALLKGSLELNDEDPAILSYWRKTEANCLLMILNFDSQTHKYTLPSILNKFMSIKFSTYHIVAENDTNHLQLRPFEGLILQLET